MFPCTHCQQPENKTIEQNVLLILWKGRNMDLCLPELTCLLKRNICWSQTFRQHLPSGVDHAPFTVCLLLYACWRQLKQHQDIVAGTASSLSNVFLTILKLKFVLNAKVFFRINYKVLEVFSWFEQQRASVLKSKTGLVKFSRPFCVLSVILLPVLPRSITKRALFILLSPEALPPCCLAPGLSRWRCSDGCASGALCGRWAEGFTHAGPSSQSEEKMSAFAFNQSQQIELWRWTMVINTQNIES